MYQLLQQQVILRGQSKSTLDNYIRRIAQISIHFGKLPEQVSDDEINEYLASLVLSSKSPSRSNFKHAVYGLRYYFRLLGNNKRAISLPSLKGDTRLPVILNRSELKELFKTPALLKHRIVLTLIYSAGLRGQEVINLKLSDIGRGVPAKVLPAHFATPLCENPTLWHLQQPGLGKQEKTKPENGYQTKGNLTGTP